MKRMVENRRGSDMAQGTRSDIKLNELLRVTTIFFRKHYMEGEFLFITVDKKYMEIKIILLERQERKRVDHCQTMHILS